MDVPRGVGQLEVEMSFLYAGFPSRQIEYLVSKFNLKNRITGNNDENLDYIKNTSGLRIYVTELAGKDGVRILIQHPSIAGMKQGLETMESLLDQVTSDFETMRESERISDLEWKLQHKIKTCICPECGKMKNHIKDLEQHFNGRHIGEKYETMTVKILGAPSGVKRSVVERALGEFGSISYIDMECHPRDIYVKFVRPVAVEKILDVTLKRRILIDGKRVTAERVKIGELEDLREALKRKPRESNRHETKADSSVLVPFQSDRGWVVDKFVDTTKESIKNFHPTRLYVRGFPREADRRQLKEYFSQYGRAEEVRVKDQGTSKAYAFVEFRTRVAMDKIFGDRDVSFLPYEDKQLTVKRVAVKASDGDQAQQSDMSDIQPETVRQIYVEGFPQLYDQKDLMSYFKVYGEIKKCTLVKASVDQPRHAFVTFTNMTAVEELMKEMLEAGGLYIRGKVLKIERRSDQIENEIRKRAGERQRKLQSDEPVVEHQTGMAKTGLPLKELKDIKERLDLVARQIAAHDVREVSSQKFWALRKQWEWLNTTKEDLEKESEWEIFGVPRSDGLKASTLAAAAHKLQEALEKLVNAGGSKETSSSYARDTSSTKSTRESWGVSTQSRASTYDRLPSGTALAGQDWKAPPQSTSSWTTWTKQPGPASTATSAYPSVLPQYMGQYSANLPGMGYGAKVSPYLPVPQPVPPPVPPPDNLQPVDMDLDDDRKQGAKWSTSPGKGIPYDQYRISVMGFTPLVQAKDLQKMFNCYGHAKDVKIYWENEMRYAFMIFSKQKAVRNLFKGKLATNVTMKDMKLICNRILETTKPGRSARILSEAVEEPEPFTASVSAPAKPTADDVPIAIPIQGEHLMVLQLLANVDDLVPPPREKQLTEAELFEDLLEREVRMVSSLQIQLNHDNPERVVRILKHLRCIHNDVIIQKILYYLRNPDVVEILSSTSKPELVKSVQKFASKIEEAKSETTEVNLYHCLRKMALVMNQVAENKRPKICTITEGATESFPILISDTDPDRPPRQKKASRWSNSDQSRPTVSAPAPATPQIREIPLQEKRKRLTKLLGELPAHKRRRVEEIFRAKVDERRNKGETVSETDEIDLYIEALGDIGKKPDKEQKSSRDRESNLRKDSRERESGSRKDKEKTQGDRKSKTSPTKKRSDQYEIKEKGKSTSSCYGKISLEGLSTAEKRVIIKKALDEIPPFIASKVKSKQKLSVTAMKKGGKEVGEVEEMQATAEAFNHMFNEEGNIMSHVLRDQIFKRRKEFSIKTDSPLKQLLLPRYDKQVQQFRRMEQAQQTEQMKTLRESLSVLLKILLFKRQDKVFEDAEKSGIELSKQEKSIIRYQILLDMTQAVVTKREEKEKRAQNIVPGNYCAESVDSQDEFDDDAESVQDSKGSAQNGAHKRSIDESDAVNVKKMKTSNDENNSMSQGEEAIVIDDEDEKEIGQEKEMVEGEKVVEPSTNVEETSSMQEDKVDDTETVVDPDNMTETENAEEDQLDKLLKDISSDDEEIDIDEFDEEKLLEEIEESKDMDTTAEEPSDMEQQENSTQSSAVSEKNQNKTDVVSEDKSAEISSDQDVFGFITEHTEENNKTSEENGATLTQQSENAEPQKESEEVSDVAQETEEEAKEKLETAFRESLTPAQRRSILGRMTKAKKSRLAAGNEMTDEEVSSLRYKMISEAVARKGK